LLPLQDSWLTGEKKIIRQSTDDSFQNIFL